MRFTVFAVATFVAAGVLSMPTPPDNHVIHEEKTSIQGWRKVSKLEGDVSLPVRIGLTQSNLHRGYELLMDVSHHTSPNYGNHYTAEEVAEIFKPSDSAVDAVKSWLAASGIAVDQISQSANKQWIQFVGSVKELEALLHTEYYVFEHERTGLQDVACEKYHVPSKIQEHVDYITPGIRLHGGRWGGKRGLRRRASDSSVTKRSISGTHTQPRQFPMEMATFLDTTKASPLANCDIVITPPCLLAMYDIQIPRKINPDNSIGVFEDLGDMFDQEDLDLFFAAFAPNIPNGTHPILNLIDGATAPAPITDAGPESTLDFSLVFPLVFPQPIHLFQTDDDVVENDYTFLGFLNNFLDAIDGSYCDFTAFGETGNSVIDPPYPDPRPGGFKGALECGVFQPTKVISISYGGDEVDLPQSYMERQCLEYMKLGMQGITVVISSGDSGVGQRDGCIVNGQDSTGFNPTAAGVTLNGTIFNPGGFVDCPFVTAVGSTFLPLGANAATDSEIATTRFPSGGGFSNFFGIPDYQAGAVADYLEIHQSQLDPASFPFYTAINGSGVGANGGIYNRGGRGIPDVAANGDNVAIFLEGAPQLIGGTSASAPTFASIITLINEQRLNAGKSTVGFINPILYAHPDVFHDITNGSNPNCGTTGFLAAEGWDPVTGLGTPKFPALLALFMAQP